MGSNPDEAIIPELSISRLPLTLRRTPQMPVLSTLIWQLCGHNSQIIELSSLVL